LSPRTGFRPCGKSLSAAGIGTESIVVPDGETSKSWPTLHDVLTQLLESKAERTTTLIALGGGVVGDIGGFAPRRSTSADAFVQVPTTCSRRSIPPSAARRASTTRSART
jgi:3-dehydroquinate synthase